EIALHRLIELVENAKENITVVSMIDSSLFKDEQRARDRYYRAVMRQIREKKDKFHYREVIQVPVEEEKAVSSSLSRNLLYRYIGYFAELQETRPSSFMLRFVDGSSV